MNPRIFDILNEFYVHTIVEMSRIGDLVVLFDMSYIIVVLDLIISLFVRYVGQMILFCIIVLSHLPLLTSSPASVSETNNTASSIDNTRKNNMKNWFRRSLST